jgi:ribosomal protein L37AE/L43A
MTKSLRNLFITLHMQRFAHDGKLLLLIWHKQHRCTLCKTRTPSEKGTLTKYRIPIWRCEPCEELAKSNNEINYYISKKEKEKLSPFALFHNDERYDSVERQNYETLVLFVGNGKKVREEIYLLKQKEKLQEKSNNLLALKQVCFFCANNHRNTNNY